MALIIDADAPQESPPKCAAEDSRGECGESVWAVRVALEVMDNPQGMRHTSNGGEICQSRVWNPMS